MQTCQGSYQSRFSWLRTTARASSSRLQSVTGLLSKERSKSTTWNQNKSMSLSISFKSKLFRLNHLKSKKKTRLTLSFCRISNKAATERSTILGRAVTQGRLTICSLRKTPSKSRRQCRCYKSNFQSTTRLKKDSMTISRLILSKSSICRSQIKPKTLYFQTKDKNYLKLLKSKKGRPSHLTTQRVWLSNLKRRLVDRAPIKIRGTRLNLREFRRLSLQRTQFLAKSRRKWANPSVLRTAIWRGSRSHLSWKNTTELWRRYRWKPRKSSWGCLFTFTPRIKSG